MVNIDINIITGIIVIGATAVIGCIYFKLEEIYRKRHLGQPKRANKVLNFKLATIIFYLFVAVFVLNYLYSIFKS